MPKAYKTFENYSWSVQNRLKRMWLDKSSDDEDSYAKDSDDEDSSSPSPKRARRVLNPTPAEQLSQFSEHDTETNEPAFKQTNLIGSGDSDCGSSNHCQSLVSNDNASIQEDSEIYVESEAIVAKDTDDTTECEFGSVQLDVDSSTSEFDSSNYEASESESENSANETIESETAHSDNNASEPESTESDNDVNAENDHRVHGNNDDPLYDGAPITVSESLIATLSLALRHNITGVLLSDILGLIALHCPPNNKCKTSLYSFRKCFSEMQSPLVRHYYCTECNREMEQQESICPSCPESKISYFIEGQITAQIKTLFKRPGFQDLLQHRHTRDRENADNYTDIYEGTVYKELSQPGAFLDNPANISLTWYTDGICIFKSSKFSIWVVYLVINELPFSERYKKENVLIAGLWFGDEKPFPHLFLAPLQESITELKQGIEVHVPNTVVPLNIKGIVICGTCDLPAKALFLNMKQYNGKFGCQKCKQEGVYLPNHQVRVYPYERIRLRTDEETRVHAQQAFDAETAVCGVKGPTILSTIVHQNMRAIAVDVMHGVFEGVVKSLVNFWFSQSFSNHPSSLREHIHLVDQRLKALTPPSYVQTRPRSIQNHLSYWKAHEFKCWFLYYSIPCINDIMDQSYFKHYQLLVLGVSLLCQTTISPVELDIASRALNEFVVEFEELYYLRHMTNNLHQLLHLAENVRQFGPLWTTSCFPFEDLNGRLKSMVHGSNSAQLQIFSTASMLMQLTCLKSQKLVQGRSAYEFCESLDSRRGRIKRLSIANSVYIVGKCTEFQQLPRELDQVLQEANVYGTRYSYFQKLLKNKVLFTSTDYKRSKRTNSSYATYYDQHGLPRIGRIRCFVRTFTCDCLGLCDCVAHSYAILRPCLTEYQFLSCIDNIALSSIHTILQFENDELAVDIASLKTVCFYCNIRDTSVKYVIEPVNLVEFE